mmetsp:Transcript_52863/g.141239  ORF Transcript_52863/g.141239 Transcript_52863/m.141239 type:complete len:261 (+) Transcript_52863:52-834(+)
MTSDDKLSVSVPPPPPAYGCRHYRRRCKIVAPCCGELFWCRHCHNEGAQNHEINRKQIQTIMCQSCFAEQEPSGSCFSCGQVFGAYYCSSCNFWDDEGLKKQVFHCEKCGICRRGGQENFFHCDKCGSCYPNEIRAGHTCVESSMHQNCPVCLRNLFQSTTQVTILQCGHTIHEECLRELQTSFVGLQSLRCPICSVSLYRFDDLWAEMDRELAETPMPLEYQHVKIPIICNDCRQCATVPFHVIGHKCPSCRSYNTRRS